MADIRKVGDVTGSNGMRAAVGVIGSDVWIRTFAGSPVDLDASQREEFSQLFVAACHEADARAARMAEEAGR